MAEHDEQGALQWHAKWTRADGTRTEWLAIDPAIRVDDEGGAKAYAARMAPKVRKASADGSAVETVREWFGRLHASKENKGLAMLSDMRAYLFRRCSGEFASTRVRGAETSQADLEAAIVRAVTMGLPGRCASASAHPGGAAAGSERHRPWNEATHVIPRHALRWPSATVLASRTRPRPVRYAVDTNIAIAMLAQRPAVLERLANVPSDEIGLSVLVVAELLFRARRSTRVGENVARVQALEGRFPVLPVTRPIVERYSVVRADLATRGVAKSGLRPRHRLRCA